MKISKKSQKILAIISIIFFVVVLLFKIISLVNYEIWLNLFGMYWENLAQLIVTPLFIFVAIILATINLFSSKEKWIRIASKIGLILPIIFIMILYGYGLINEITTNIGIEFYYLLGFLIINLIFILTTLSLKIKTKIYQKVIFWISEVISYAIFLLMYVLTSVRFG